MGRRRAAIALILASATGGCTVGPDFKRPDAPAATRYTTTPLPEKTDSADVPGGQAQAWVAGRDVPAEWWRLFESESLDTLVRTALADSPVVAQMNAKLVRAQQDYEARSGATRLPKIDASVRGLGATVGGQNNPLVDFPVTLGLASVGVSYSLDLFGRGRRELEGLQADVDYQRFELTASQLMLAGNVVTTAIQQASLKEQIVTTEEVIALAARQLDIVLRLEQLGGVAHVDVVQHQGELARIRATLPALHAQLEKTRHRLAVYLGQLPGEAQLPEIALSELHLPSELPLSVPSHLVRQRPDIQAAEALLHEASARVGVATANFYPQITLSGTGGAVTVSALLSGVAGFAVLGATLAQPIFHGGELKAQKRAAVAAFDQAGGHYREVVLAGFQNVADVLTALDADATTLRERVEAASSAKSAYDVTSKRYEAGGVSLLALLDAQRESLTSSLDRTRALADRYSDSAALFQALGGGWWADDAKRAPATESKSSPSTAGLK
jgi:NodT family efflux transporter outer membrane factor (OMF) lipoprotein